MSDQGSGDIVRRETDQASSYLEDGDRADVVTSFAYSAPLPPAAELAAYEKACPGLAREIANIAIREQTHRHQLQNKDQDADILDVRTSIKNTHSENILGQFFAFGTVLAILATAAYGFSLGHPIVSGLLGGSTILSLVALFLKQKMYDTKDETPEDDQ